MINHTFTWDEPQINTLLEDATRALGELNAFTMNGNSAIVSRIIKQAIEDGLIRLHDPEANRKSWRYVPFWA